MTALKTIKSKITSMLFVDIDEQYNKFGRLHSKQVVQDLSVLPRYKDLIEEAGAQTAYSWFASCVQDVMRSAAFDTTNEKQHTFPFPEWKKLRLPGGVCLENGPEGVAYMRRVDMNRTEYRGACGFLRKRIGDDLRSVEALEAHDRRLEPLRQLYGDLPEKELIRRAIEDRQSDHFQGEANRGDNA